MAPITVRSWTMHRLPIVILPPRDSRRARGWITDSDAIVIGFEPVRTAESAIVIDDENCTGGFGPAWIGGNMEWRLEDDIVVVDVCVSRCWLFGELGSKLPTTSLACLFQCVTFTGTAVVERPQLSPQNPDATSWRPISAAQIQFPRRRSIQSVPQRRSVDLSNRQHQNPPPSGPIANWHPQPPSALLSR